MPHDHSQDDAAMARHFDVFNTPSSWPVTWKKSEKHKIVRTLMFQGLEIKIETDKGQTREWYDPNSKRTGHTRMAYPYGFFSRTTGADGEELDVYVGPDEDSDQVFVVHQMKRPDFKKFDEDKVMIGFSSVREARAAYLMHYNDKRFLGDMSEMSMAEFKKEFGVSVAKSTKAYGWLGVDLDGTLAEYDYFRGKTVIGKPIAPMVEKVKEELSRGRTVKIFTARADGDGKDVIAAIQAWCKEHLGQELPVTNRKDPEMTELWDDRAREVIPNTGNFARKAFPTDASPMGGAPQMPGVMPGAVNPMTGMPMGPPPIDVETLDGVQQLLGRIGGVPDPQLMEIATKIWGEGYNFQGQKPEQARQEITGFLLDQRDLLGVAPDPNVLQTSQESPNTEPGMSNDSLAASVLSPATTSVQQPAGKSPGAESPENSWMSWLQQGSSQSM